MASSLAELAKAIFNNSDKKTLHVDEIAGRILALQPSLGNLETVSKKLAGALLQNSKTQNPIFKRVKNDKGKFKKGYYCLKAVKNKPQIIPERFTSLDISSAFTAKAAEFSVAAELMFHGFNANILPVDVGMDVVAAKDNKYFHIQVKSCFSKNEIRDFSFSIKKHVFQNNSTSHDFYVFVMRSPIRGKWVTNYAIFPSNEINRMMVDRLINSDADNLSFRISYESGKFLLGRAKADITNWNINNFTLIN